MKLKSYYHKNQIELLNTPFAGGGEGDLFKIIKPQASKGRYIAKLYHPHKLTTERQAKLQYLYKNNPVTIDQQRIPTLIWITDLLYDSKNKLRGFVMPFVKGDKLEILCTSKLPKKVASHWQRFSFRSPKSLDLRMRLCFNIAVAIYQLHNTQNYVLVDLKPDNIMVQPNGIIALVDLDSVEVIEGEKTLFDAPVATPEYTPAEFYIQDQLGYDPTARQEWDLFSMTVIFYKLLFGIHPFAAGNKGPYENCLTLEQKIEKGLFVHNPSMQEFMSIIPPPHKKFKQIHQGLQDLFVQCFSAGHHDPKQRPTSEEWCVALLNAIDDPKLHEYFDHLFAVKSFDFRHEHERKLPSQIYQFDKIQSELKEKLLPDFLDYTPGQLPINKLPARSNYQFSNKTGSVRTTVATMGIVSSVLIALMSGGLVGVIFGILSFFLSLMTAELLDQMVYKNTPQFIEKTRVKHKLRSLSSLYKRKLSSWKSTMSGVRLAYLEKINDRLNQFLTEKRDYFVNLMQAMDQKVQQLIKEENKRYEKSYQNFIEKLSKRSIFDSFEGTTPAEIKAEIFKKREEKWKDQLRVFNELSLAYRQEYLEDKKQFDERYQKLVIQNRKEFLEQKDEVFDYKDELNHETLDYLRTRFPIEIGKKYATDLENLYKELIVLSAEDQALKGITLKKFRSNKQNLLK